MGITKEEWNEIIEDRKSLYRIDPLNIYSNNYFRWRRKSHRDKQMRQGEIMSNLFNIESMIDFGCALGSYLEGALKGKTKRVLGIDPCYDRLIKWVPENMRPFIKKEHAGKKLDLGKWDCSLSINTAEHLLPEEEDTFVDNIINASSRLIIFYAAKSFDKWHLNPKKSRKYWVRVFSKKGCRELVDEKRKLSEIWVAETSINLKGSVCRKLIIMTVK